MAGITDILIIVLILGAGYWLISSGKLNEIMGTGIEPAGAPAPDIEDVSGEHAYAEAGPDQTDIDVSGPGAGACANGVCKGDPAAIRRAQELLEEIQN